MNRRGHYISKYNAAKPAQTAIKIWWDNVDANHRGQSDVSKPGNSWTNMATIALGGASFVGGAQRFLFKGTNGRWKDVLLTEENTLYEQSIAEILTPGCARWLEQGRVVQ